MDLLSSYGAISSQIDTLWNIFMLVHVTLFAGLWKLDETKGPKAGLRPSAGEAAPPVRRLGWVEWIGLFSGYAVFAFLNWNALRGDYNILDHLARDITQSTGDTLKHAANTINAIRKQKPLHRELVVTAVHLGAAFFILLYSLYVSSDRDLPLTWGKVTETFREAKARAGRVTIRSRR